MGRVGSLDRELDLLCLEAGAEAEAEAEVAALSPSLPEELDLCQLLSRVSTSWRRGEAAVTEAAEAAEDWWWCWCWCWASCSLRSSDEWL